MANCISSHKETVKTGLPYSEFLRVKRICSTDTEFEKNCALLGAHFLRRGYPLDILEQAFHKVKLLERVSLLYSETPPSDNPVDASNDAANNIERENFFSITTYNPAGNPNEKIIKTNWPLLGMSNITQPLFRHRVIHGNRRCPNLRDKLVHSKLKIVSTHTRGLSGAPIKECTLTYCRYCTRLNTSGEITSPSTGEKSKCCKNVTCHSSNLIYCIRCTFCNILYVGQTKRELKKRMVEHFRYITKPDLSQPLGVHFNQPNHPKLDAVEIYVLKFVKADLYSQRAKALRDQCELQWIPIEQRGKSGSNEMICLVTISLNQYIPPPVGRMGFWIFTNSVPSVCDKMFHFCDFHIFIKYEDSHKGSTYFPSIYGDFHIYDILHCLQYF